MSVATLVNAKSIGRTRAFLTVFIPLVGLLAGLLGFVYLVEVRTETRIFAQTEQKVVDSLDAVAMGVVAEAVSDVMFLADHHALKDFLDGDTNQRYALEQDYLAFSLRKRIYDQIRYLDETGMEVVRVNFNGGDPRTVPTERLQNKAKRYYFSDAFELGPDEVFASPLDLNIERGEIEQPLKPMLRIATPVFDRTGRKRGIVLVNFLIEITVTDNGIGFEAKHAERVFGTFQRLHGRSQYEGTGIGLSVCRKIAQRHQGRIEANSELGQGATFTITLPANQSREYRDAA